MTEPSQRARELLAAEFAEAYRDDVPGMETIPALAALRAIDAALALSVSDGNRLLEALPLIEQICAEEGATVTLTGSNPDFNGLPNEAVEICNDKTRWKPWTFRADTVADCLRKALSDKCPGCEEVTLADYQALLRGRPTCGWCGHLLDTGTPSGLEPAALAHQPSKEDVG